MNWYDAADANAFGMLKENPIILDFSGCKYLGEIHLVLKKKFGFPAYYGENWDALWDCLDGLFHDRGVFQVHIQGFMSLEKEQRECCKTMLEIFDDVHKKTQNVTFSIIS